MSAAQFARLGQKCERVYKIELKPVVLEIESKVNSSYFNYTFQVWKEVRWSDGKSSVQNRVTIIFNNDEEFKNFKTQVMML